MASGEGHSLRPQVLVPLLLGGLVVYMAFLVFRPFILDFVVAASVALLVAPVHSRLSRWLGGRRTIAAALVVLLVAVVILLPVASLVIFLGAQAGNAFDWLRPHLTPQAVEEALRGLTRRVPPWLQPWLDGRDHDQVSVLVSAVLSRTAAGANAVLQRLVTGLAAALFELTLFLMMLFFLLTDGGRLRAEVRRISPLRDAQEEQIFEHLGRTVKGVLQAMLLVPLAQGVLGTLGFWLFGVPSPLLWGVAVVLAALVPILGSPLAWVPACVYLFVTGSQAQGIGMLIYGLTVISTIDNIVKPLLLQEAAQIHPLLGFLAILGGLFAFGPLGFLVGPVILSLVLSAIRIYRLDVLRAGGTDTA
jgi:predicted PurR-regulated permease PerM